jgi:hypothetical protein
MAALLLFVDPLTITKCQEWHIACGRVTKKFETLEELELVDMVRFLWKWDLFSQETRWDYTMNAMGRLESGLTDDLRSALSRTYPNDEWILERFPRESVPLRALNAGMAPHENLTLDSYYSAGNSEECRICSYRPQKKPLFQRVEQKLSRLMTLSPYYCDNCSFMSMESSLVARATHEDSDVEVGTEVNAGDVDKAGIDTADRISNEANQDASFGDN